MAANWVFNCGRFLILILVPLVLIIVLFVPYWYYPKSSDSNSRGLLEYELRWVYVAVLAGVFWMFNILHIAATSFIPLVGLPLFGIVNAKELATSFMCDYNLITFGSIVLMMATDACGMKRRLSLLILKHSSGSIRWIFVDVYLATTWVAMWINSAAATYFMMQVIDDLLESLNAEAGIGALGEERVAVISEIERAKSEKSSSKLEPSTAVEVEASKAPGTEESTASVPVTVKENDAVAEPSTAVTVEGFQAENEQLLNDFGGELLYATAVAANLGGMLWPFGSPMGFDIRNAVPSLTLASWIIYSLPLLMINTLVALGYLFSVHFGISRFLLLEPKKRRLADCKQSQETLQRISTVFSSQYAALPPWNAREKWLLFTIPFAIFLCLTRHPGFISGWATPIQESAPKKPFFIGDSVSYTVIALLLFLIPPWGIKVFKCSGALAAKSKTPQPTVLGWKRLQSSYPFTIMMLIGGATCLGKFSALPVAVPMSSYLYQRFPNLTDNQLKIVMMMTTVCFTIFIPTPGTSIAITQLWANLVPQYLQKNTQVGASSLLPVLSVASLCFILPSSSVPTALVFRYQNKKVLSAWYFLRIGIPLFLSILPVTLIYALLWTPSSLVR